MSKFGSAFIRQQLLDALPWNFMIRQRYEKVDESIWTSIDYGSRRENQSRSHNWRLCTLACAVVLPLAPRLATRLPNNLGMLDAEKASVS